MFAPLAAKAKRKVPSPATAAFTPSPRLAPIRTHYGVDFPDELLAIWDLALSLSPKRPRRAFADGKRGRHHPRGPVSISWRGDTKVKSGARRPPPLALPQRPAPELFFTVAREATWMALHFGYWFDDA